MPDLSESDRAACERLLGVKVVKVKRTDQPGVGLALLEGGYGLWIDLRAGKAVKAGTIGGEKVTKIKRPTAKRFPGLKIPT